MYFRERIKIIKNDSYLALVLKIAFAFIFLHLYQFYDSGFSFQPLARIIISVLLFIAIFFFGRIGSYWIFFGYANFLACQTTFQNYTAFVIIVIFSMLVPKMKFLSLALYSCEIVAIATLRNKTPVHIAIHVLNCICFYYALNYLLKPTVNQRKLDLTPDEILIIEELLIGKNQKEIERFSQNTVTNKLKNARNRNNIPSTDELLITYNEQKTT